jgi:hypothetical protein
VNSRDDAMISASYSPQRRLARNGSLLVKRPVLDLPVSGNYTVLIMMRKRRLPAGVRKVTHSSGIRPDRARRTISRPAASPGARARLTAEL